jgi:hypothetical protein
MGRDEMRVVLPEDERLVRDLLMYKRTEKYIKQNVSVSQQENIKRNLRNLLTQFEEADNFGSLIRPMAMDYAEIRRVLAEKGIGNQLLLEHVHRDVMRVLDQAEYLSQRYQVLVANPPYMGSAGMNGRLTEWAKINYPDSKADLFAMFIERNLDLVAKQGAVGMITMQSWMFLSSFEKFRVGLFNSKTLSSMAHLGPRAFDSIGGEVVSSSDEEKDIEEEIKNTEVESADVAAELEKLVFDHIIKQRKIRYADNGQDYPRSGDADLPMGERARPARRQSGRLGAPHGHCPVCAA